MKKQHIRFSVSCKVCLPNYKYKYNEGEGINEIIRDTICRAYNLTPGEEVFYDKNDPERTPIIDYSKCDGKTLVMLCDKNHPTFDDLFYSETFPIYNFDYLLSVYVTQNKKKDPPPFSSFILAMESINFLPLPYDIRNIIRRMLPVVSVWDGIMSYYAIRLIQDRCYLTKPLRLKNKPVSDLKEEIRIRRLRGPQKGRGSGKNGRITKVDYIKVIHEDIFRIARNWGIISRDS